MQYSRPSSFLGSIDDRRLPPGLDDAGYVGKIGLAGNADMHVEGASVEPSL